MDAVGWNRYILELHWNALVAHETPAEKRRRKEHETGKKTHADQSARRVGWEKLVFEEEKE